MVISSSSGKKIILPERQITSIAVSVKFQAALVTFAKAGGATALSVFIPVFHFVTVPVGIILTSFLSYSAYKRNYLLVNFEIHCPTCDQKSTTNIYGPTLPLRTYCCHCNHMVYLNN